MANTDRVMEVNITCHIKKGTKLGIKLINLIARIFKVTIVHDITGELE